MHQWPSFNQDTSTIVLQVEGSFMSLSPFSVWDHTENWWATCMVCAEMTSFADIAYERHR